MINRMGAIIRKEFIQIVRDKRTLAIVLWMPVMQLLIFGYAINTNVEDIPLAVYDAAHDRESRELTQAFVNSGYFLVAKHVDSLPAARQAVDDGSAKAALIIPAEYARDIAEGKPAPIQFLIDGSDPNIAQTALFTAGNIAQARSFELVSNRVRSAAPVDFRPAILYNPGMLSVNFMIPGLIGLILQFQTLILTAFAIVRERERGTLEQLIVTPIRSWELMIGKLLPYTVIAFINIGMIMVIGVTVFGVEIAGSVPLLLGLAVLFLMSSLGIGLLLSTVSQTQTQAVQLALFIMLPSVLLSGFMFARESMPLPLADFALLIPLTHFLVIVRGIILKGVGIEPLWSSVIPLAAFGFGVFSLAVVRFRKRIA